jgi:hypothetical protein
MDQFTLRVDHRLSGNDTLFGRFTTSTTLSLHGIPAGIRQ